MTAEDDLTAALRALPADPFVAPGQAETPDEVFATDATPKPLTATLQREADRRRRVAAGFGKHHARESKEGSP